MRVCLSNCAAVVGEGAACSTDPCAPNPTVCNSDARLTCVQGVCQAIGYRGPLAFCQPGASGEPCDLGLFCFDINRFHVGCAPMAPGDTPDFGSPYCSMARQENATCDSNLGQPLCQPCGMGLVCNRGRCQRSCEGDPDCPCDISACFTGYCSDCNAGGPGTPCPTGKCCNHALQCGIQGTCCLPNGQACSSRDDCCGQACVAGKCVTCTTPGGSPTTGSGDQCCPNEQYQSGKCIIPCAKQVGDPCIVTRDAYGTPVYGLCQHGTVSVCDPDGTYTCKPGTPSPETCNGLDDNCDGKVDNLTGTCTTTVPGGCSVTGHNACANGTQICSAVAGTDYCTRCGQMVNGASCGQCYGQICYGERDCPPNTLCEGKPTAQCMQQTGCPEAVDCWLPANLNYNRSNCFDPTNPK